MIHNIPSFFTIQSEDFEKFNDLLEFYSEKDNPRINLTITHGFLCGILSTPSDVRPHVWQSMLVRMQELPPGKSLYLRNLMLQFQAQTKIQLEQEVPCQPFLYKDRKYIPYNDAEEELIKHWCQGYLYGYSTDSGFYVESKPEYRDFMAVSLLPFGILADHYYMANKLLKPGGLFEGKSDLDIFNSDHCRSILPANITTLYRMGKERRGIKSI